MDINLEKIELVKDRTGASYNEAKEALERSEGSVVDAIIDIEQKLDSEFDAVNSSSLTDSAVFQKMKEIVEKGNISKIVIRKDDKDIVNFPVTVGVAGAIIVPWVVIVGITAAIGTKCEISFIDVDGNEIDLNGKVVGLYDKTKEAVENFAAADKVGQVKDAGQKAVEKGKDAWAEFSKEGGTLEKMSDYTFKAYDKVQDIAEAGQAKVEAAYEKLEAAYKKADEEGKVDELKEKADEVANKAMEALNAVREALKKEK